MPRGGSKKGEHRGAAKREAKRGVGAPPGNNNNPEGRPKGTRNRATMERLAAVSAAVGVAELGGIMPREMLLELSRILYQLTMNDMAAMAAEQDPTRQAELLQSMKQNAILAGDMNYKAASYWHPRLQALAVAGNAGVPADVLRSLLDEIDGETRELKQIEHRPQTLEADALDDVLDEKVA